MKFSFIHPAPWDFERTLATSSWPPIGILHIASFLEREGIEVSVLDHAAKACSLQDVTKWVKKENPDLLGFSVLTTSSLTAVKIAEEVKKENPHLPIVFGGVHATFNAERLLRKYDCINVIVLGEGEQTCLELAERFEDGGDLKEVRGISFRQGERIVSTLERPLNKDVDHLPFPDRGLLNDEYHSVICGIAVAPKRFTTMLSSRGCSYSCRFCECSKFTHNFWRARSVENIIEEMMLIESQGYKQVLFVDDNFTLNWKRVVKLCRRMREEGIDLDWFCDSRVDRCSYDMLREMTRAGCKLLYLGVESANQRILDYYRKGTTPQQSMEAARKARKAGIDIIVGSFIVGAPHESRKEIENTLKFAQRIDIDVAQFNLLMVFPGTALWAEMERKTSIDAEKYWETGMGVSEFSPLSDEIRRIFHERFREFYLRPRFIASQMMKTLKSRFRFEVVLNNLGRYHDVKEGFRLASRV